MDNSNIGNVGNIENIKKLYSKKTYFDLYAGSTFQFIFVTIVFVAVIVYCYLMSKSEIIKKDWANQRCNPLIIPFAGLINKPDGMTAAEFTKQNYDDCNKTILTNTVTLNTAPLEFLMKSLSSTMDDVKKTVNDNMGMINSVQGSIEKTGNQTKELIKTIVVPIQQFIIGVKDVMGKTQAVSAAGLYTFMGTFLTLKAMMGAIVEIAGKILIILAAAILALWISSVFFPFSAIAAGTLTAIFVGITTPLVLIVAFMATALKLHPTLGIPKLKCFDKDTLFPMNDGTRKKVVDIVVGDVLEDNNRVTGKFKVESAGSRMYDLNGVVVSNSHIVKHGDSWIPVSEHPDATRIAYYKGPFLYCMNTSSKQIHVNGMCFTDWDEIYDGDIENLKENARLNDIDDIHSRLGSGIVGTTMMKLNDGTCKELRQLQVGDVLEHGERIYGLVQVDGLGLFEQCRYTLFNDSFIEGGVNLCACDERVMAATTLDVSECDKRALKTRHDVLYNLLTDTDTFFCNGIRFHDYNASIDMFLDKNRGRLLAMNYL